MTEKFPTLLVDKQILNCKRNCADGTGNDYPCLCILDLILNLHLIGDDHRAATSHCLRHNNSKILRVAGQNKDIRGIVESAWRWHKAHPRGYGD